MRAFRYADEFVPDDLKTGSPDARRRGRLVTLLCLCMLCWAPAFAALYALLGSWYLGSVCLLSGVFVGAGPWVLRATKSVSVATHVLVGPGFVALNLISWQTGGVSAPSTAWLGLIVTISVALAGRRIGGLYAVASVLAVGAMAVFSWWAGPIPMVFEGAARSLVIDVGFLTLPIALYSLSYLADLANDEMNQELEAARLQAHAAREIAVEALETAEKAHDRARLIFDNVHFGLATIALDGKIQPGSSAALERWFGPFDQEMLFSDLIGRANPVDGEWFEFAWAQVLSGMLPMDLCLAQLPPRLQFDGRVFQLHYLTLREHGELFGVIAVITDITADEARSRSEREQREVISMLERYVSDRRGVHRFLDEASGIVRRLCAHGVTFEECGGLLHTLRGNSGLYGLGTMSTLCHELQSTLREERVALGPDQQDELRYAWDAVLARLSPLLGETSRNQVPLTLSEHSAFVEQVRARTSHDVLLQTALSWQFEPVSSQLHRLAEHAVGLAERRGKGPLQVCIEHDETRVNPMPWAPFWDAVVHVVRNSVHHGYAGGRGAGAERAACLWLDARQVGGDLRVEVRDNGCGVNWDAVSKWARDNGFPANSRGDLTRALLHPRFAASKNAGGMTLFKIRAVAENFGGSLAIESSAEGVTAVFLIPMGRVHALV